MIIDQITNTISSLIKNSLYFVNYQTTRIQDFASSLKGNSRHFIFTEWNWLIPITWTSFYAAPYMKELGMSGEEIGLIGGLAIAVQAIASVLSGFFAERWGHKKTMMIFDAITWPTSYLIFAFAQNVWWIIAATILNNMFFVVMPAWSCLFIEGVKEEKRSNVYAILAIAANTAALFMPLAGVFISMFGFMKAMRLMFFAGSLAMSAGLIYRAFKIKETEEGCRLVKEKNVYSFKSEFGKFKESFMKIRKRAELLWFCVVQMLVIFALVMGNTFSTLFLTEKKGLGLDKSDITVLPFVFAIVMVAIMLIFIPSIKKEHYKKYLVRGTMLAVIGYLIYVVSPANTTSFVLIAAVLSGVWMAFFRPLSDAYSVNILSDTERTRILSVFNTLLLVSAIPAAPVAGLIYSYSPRLLFGAVALVLVAAIVIIKTKFSYGEGKG